jgi:hypothetical protein
MGVLDLSSALLKLPLKSSHDVILDEKQHFDYIYHVVREVDLGLVDEGIRSVAVED